MNREEYEKRYKEVSKLFSPEFMRKVDDRDHNIHIQIFEALIHDCSAYVLIEQLCDNFENTQKEFANHLMYGPPPRYIAHLTDEQVKMLKKKDDEKH